MATSCNAASLAAILRHRSCWSAPARWAAPCSTAGSRAGSTPKKVVVIEPQPAKAIKALAERGVRINPKGDVGTVAALVIAVKPQIAPDVRAAARGAGRTARPSWSRSWPAARSAFSKQRLPSAAIVRAMPNTPAAIGRGITVAVAERAASRARSASSTHALLAATGAVEWVDDESADRRGDRGVRLGPGLCVPAGRGAGAGRRRRRPAGRPRRQAGARDRRRLRRTAASLGARRRDACARTSPRPAAPPRRRSTC